VRYIALGRKLWRAEESVQHAQLSKPALWQPLPAAFADECCFAEGTQRRRFIVSSAAETRLV
jgi:hypothetical protein